MGMVGRFLHCGCGERELPEWAIGCDETRLDIDPKTKPDIVASITDMGDIGGFDVVFSSHCLEHLYPHEVLTAVKEFRRVLRVGGCVVIDVPDLENVRATRDMVYMAPCGPICGLDMIYGKASMIEDRPFMAHHCGFVSDTLREVMQAAGFEKITMTSSMDNLTGIGIKQ